MKAGGLSVRSRRKTHHYTFFWASIEYSKKIIKFGHLIHCLPHFQPETCPKTQAHPVTAKFRNRVDPFVDSRCPLYLEMTLQRTKTALSPNGTPSCEARCTHAVQIQRGCENKGLIFRTCSYVRGHYETKY